MYRSLSSRRPQSVIPARAGVGLKPEHYRDMVSMQPDIGWFEVHPENYMGEGGAPHAWLERIRADYPISLHGVGLSIGSAGGLSRDHLIRLKELIARYEPGLFSEHLAWSTHETHYLNDLLPLPYTEATLALVADHVDEVQEVLGRRILLENPSTYVTFAGNEMSETTFLSRLAERTGCGLLLDVNNAYVSAVNHGLDVEQYLSSFPMAYVGEIHLAGHAEAMAAEADEAPLIIDTHDRAVAQEVWRLYGRVVEGLGARPTLIEWDSDIPAASVLLAEAARADDIMRRAGRQREGLRRDEVQCDEQHRCSPLPLVSEACVGRKRQVVANFGNGTLV